MNQWHLDSLLEELKSVGFRTLQIQGGDLALTRNRTLVTLPLGIGEWLPEIVVRNNLRDAGLDIDQLADRVKMK